MGQKTDPTLLRLNKTNQHWNSCWYSDDDYATQFLEDYRINAYIKNCSQQLKKIPPILFVKKQRGDLQIALFSTKFAQGMARMGNRYYKRRNSFERIRRFDTQRYTKFSVVKRLPTDRNSFASAPSDAQLPFPQMLAFTQQVNSNRPYTTLLGMSNISLISSFFMEKRAAKTKATVAQLPIRRKDPLHATNPTDTNAPYKDAIVLAEKRSQKCSITLLSFLFTSQLCFAPSLASSRAGAAGELIPATGIMPYVETNYFDLTRPISPYAKPMIIEDENFHQSVGRRFAMRSNVQGSKPWKSNVWREKRKMPLKNHMECSLYSGTQLKSKIHLLKCPSIHQNPSFLAGQIVFLLQERVAFRRLKHRIIEEIRKDVNIKGIRITCSGRVAARSKKAQKARTDSIQWGATSLNIFSEYLSFASCYAQTTFGKIGVKVWICYEREQIAIGKGA